MGELRVDISSTYRRQYRKLKTEALKDDADGCFDDLVVLVTMRRSGQGTSDDARNIIRDGRIKVIQRFAKKRPQRFEATFAPDGRIVWSVDSDTLRLIYIGTHKVLDMN